MFNWWPFTSKEKEDFTPRRTSVKPSDLWIEECSKGNLQCIHIPYQYMNWAFEYMGEDKRVAAGDHCYNKDIVILTGACIRWLEDEE